MLTCTSEASTGSVGASIAPSNTAAPSGRPRPHTPSAVMAATVITIDTVASCTGMRQRWWRSGSSNFMPAVKSEISTAISVSRSSSSALLKASSCSSRKPSGPMATPTPR